MPSYASGAAGSLPADVSVAMSPPAQKDLPTARTTSAPTSGLASTSSNVAISSSAIAGVSALRRSGAFSVTIATPPSTSSSTSPDPATSPPLITELPASLRASSPHLASDHEPPRDQGLGPSRAAPRTGTPDDRVLVSACVDPFEERIPPGSDRSRLLQLRRHPGDPTAAAWPPLAEDARRNGQVALDPLCS